MKEKIDGLKAYNNFTQRTCNVMNEVKIKEITNKAIKKAIGRHFKKTKK